MPRYCTLLIAVLACSTGCERPGEAQAPQTTAVASPSVSAPSEPREPSSRWPGPEVRAALAKVKGKLRVLLVATPDAPNLEQARRYGDHVAAMSGGELSEHDFFASPGLCEEHGVRRSSLVLVAEPWTAVIPIPAERSGDDERETLEQLDEAVAKKLTTKVTRGDIHLWTDVEAKDHEAVGKLIEHFGVLKRLPPDWTDIPPFSKAVVVILEAGDLTVVQDAALAEYLEQGGALLVAINPEVPLGPRVASFLGVTYDKTTLCNDKVLLHVHRFDADKANLVVDRFSGHPAVATLARTGGRGTAVVMLRAGSFDIEPASSTVPIMRTMPGTYRDTNLNWRHDAGEERKAFVVGVAHESKGSRAIAVADAEMLTGGVFVQVATNRLFFGEALQWLIATP